MPSTRRLPGRAEGWGPHSRGHEGVAELRPGFFTMKMMIAHSRLALVATLSMAVAVQSLTLRVRSSPMRASVTMLAKPFKGGRLDDFLAAGAAEAKYGPQRYAARYEDLQNIEVAKDKSNKEREYSRLVYEALKKQLLADHVFLSFLGCVIVWYFFDLFAVRSYALGAILGALYLVLAQRSADGFGATTFEEKKSGPPALIVPVLMVLLAAKNPDSIGFLPIFAGFLTERLAFVAQAFYPGDFGLTPEETVDRGADS